MKKIISTFISASLKIKCIIAISTVIVLTTGITVTAHFLGEQNNTKIAIDNEQEAIIEDFDKVDIRTGTVIDVSINKRARNKAYKVTIDFGEEIGVKTSSAQITDLYKEQDLIGKQVIAVVNFLPIRIGDVKSEVRILGTENQDGVVLLSSDQKVPNGLRIF